MLAKNESMEELFWYIHNDAWWVEQKLDGHRVLIESKGDEAVALNRHGERYMHAFSAEILEAIAGAFGGEHVIVDGEYLDGVYYVFDLAFFVIDKPFTFSERRHSLELWFQLWSHPKVQLVKCAKEPAEKQALIHMVRESGGEGVMLKRKNGLYSSGSRSDAMFKAKFVKTAEVIVLEPYHEDKQAMRIALYHQEHIIETGSVNMIHHTDILSELKPGDVVEIKYIYAHKGQGKFRFVQPIFMRRRDDKSPQECTTGQLEYTNKAVV